MSTRSARLMFALATVAGLLSATATAGADSRVCTAPQGLTAGCVAFRTQNVDVCDYATDGRSVVAEYRVGGAGAKKYLVNYWGRAKYNGCRRFAKSFAHGTTVTFRACEADNAKPGGKPMKVLAYTCGPRATARY